jgi:hypothetical protein
MRFHELIMDAGVATLVYIRVPIAEHIAASQIQEKNK